MNKLIIGLFVISALLFAFNQATAKEVYTPPDGCTVNEDIVWEPGVVTSWGGHRDNICGVAIQVAASDEWFSWFPPSPGSIGFTRDGWDLEFSIQESWFRVDASNTTLTRGMLYVGTPLFTATPTPVPTLAPTPMPTMSVPPPEPAPYINRYRVWIPTVRHIGFVVGPPPTLPPPLPPPLP